MRDLTEVAKQIQNVLPEELKHRIDYYTKPENFAYTPPEMMPGIWSQLGVFCNDLLEGEFPPKEDWKVKMISILIDKPEDWVREHDRNKKEDYAEAEKYR